MDNLGAISAAAAELSVLGSCSASKTALTALRAWLLPASRDSKLAAAAAAAGLPMLLLLLCAMFWLTIRCGSST
jgi:hypothetical protein